MKFLAALVVAISIVTFIFIAIRALEEPLNRTLDITLVGTYNDCNVLRLSVPTEARYHYLLECQTKKLTH